MNRGNGQVAAWIYNQYGRNAQTGAEAGAAQVAIWEALYDTGGSPASGNSRLTSWEAGFDYTRAQNIVTAAAGQSSLAGYYRAAATGRQDLIGPPEPEPLSAHLLAFGLMGSALVVRVRRRR